MAKLAPLGPGTVHVAVDLQRLFAEPTLWAVAGLTAIVPNVTALAALKRERTLFTRFVVPDTEDQATGWWKRYYQHWSDFTGAKLAPGMVDLIGDLTRFAHAENVIDKPTHSAFEVPEFEARLKAMDAETLIVTGVETDVCVLATVLTAVDRGYRVVAVSDALASSSLDGHRATLDHVLTRFDQQVEIMTTAEVLQEWR